MWLDIILNNQYKTNVLEATMSPTNQQKQV